MNQIVVCLLLPFLLISAIALPAAEPLLSSVPEYRVLILGDSITLHAPKESIQWTNHHGMAASASKKDYVHLVLAALGKEMPGVRVKELIPDGVGWVQGALSKVSQYQQFQPDFVVIQLGEHEFSDGRLPRLEQDYAALLNRLQALKSNPVIVCTGVWNPDLKTNAPYSGDTKRIESTMAQACARAQVAFVSIEDLARDPSCHGFGQMRGVQWHPNDKGMLGYATRIVNAWSAERNERSKKTSGRSAAAQFSPASRL